MKIHLSGCFLCFVLLSANTLGQINYKKGFVITNQGDTLQGLIRDGGTMRNSTVCLFKSDNRTKAVKYSPGDISSYQMTNDKQYISKEVFYKGGYRKEFIEVLVSGQVSLYYHHKNPEMKFFIEKTKDSLIGLVNKKVSIPVSSTGLYGLMNNEKAPLVSDKFSEQLNASIYIDLYKDSLYSIFSNNEAIQNEVPNLKYTHRSLMSITKEYIYQTCGSENCIQYEKNLRINHPSFGFYSGYQFSNIIYWKFKDDYRSYNSRVESNTFSSVPLSLFCSFPITYISEFISLKIEARTNKINYNQGAIDLPWPHSEIFIESSNISFPISLNYRLTNHKISPTFGAGKEIAFVYDSQVQINNNPKRTLHGSQKGGWFADLGVDYRLKQKLSLFAAVRAESFRNLIVSTESTFARSSYDAIMENGNFDLFTTRCFAFQLGIKF
ncbi:MAG: hypothetical protein U0T82_08365 [Bacteroidales bacterium]